MIYENLNPNHREIRLLRFVAASDAANPNSRLQLHLEKASLNESPSYHALSYVWGNRTSAFPITVNDEHFDVGETLHFALQQLSRAVPAGIWLWIDAICIDQQNIEEKNSQVVQMRDIFQTAQRVWISLGDSSEGVDLLLDLANALGQKAKVAGILELWNGWSYHGPRKPLDPEDPAKHPELLFLLKVLECEDLRDHRVFSAIKDILGRQYWSRVWVVQEVTLAESGEILCGEKRVDLNAFHAALTAIYFAKIDRFARQQLQWKNFGSGLNNNHFHIHGLLSRLQHLRGQGSGLLQLLLSDMRGGDGRRPFYAASDPRDIIFALLGIASDSKILGLQPDYHKPVQQVYTEATTAMIVHCPDYRLEYCSFPKDTPGLPSWVPDWQRIGRLGIFHPLSYGVYVHASRGRTQPPTAPNSTPTLKQKGILIDSVASVFNFEMGASKQGTEATGMSLANALKSRTSRTICLESILNFAEAHSANKSSPSSVWGLMLGGQWGTDKNRSDLDDIIQRAFRQESVAAESINELQLKCILRNSYPFPRILKEGEDIQPIIDEYCHGIVDTSAMVACRRTLFATLSGALGLGPYRVCEGDSVTVLFGTQVPIILRPSGVAYTYVGDAYIDGAMDGEYMSGEHEEHEFHIV